MTVDLWSDSRGPRGFTVWVGERADKGMTVWLRWYVAGQPRYEMTEVRTVRDSRNRLSKRSVAAAIQEAERKSLELQGHVPARRTKGPVTLGLGGEMAFSPRGLYPHPLEDDQYTRQTKGNYDLAVELLGGSEVLYEEVTPGMVRSIWRNLFERAGDGSGANKAEKVVVAFYAIARWLEGEFPEQRFPRPIARWRAELKEHWKKRGFDLNPDQPPYTEEEGNKLFRHRSEGDPRLVLALVLGGELRGGQLVNTMRSHCELENDRWRVQIPYVSRRKAAPRLTLSPTERAAFEEAISTGYLSDCEAAFQAGEIDDYALFPSGKLRQGKANVGRARKPMDRSTLRRMLTELEAKAGVEHVEGRAWHGLRRMFSDLYEVDVQDARVKDRLGGWSPGSEMRRKIYQSKDSEKLDDAAAEARERLRPGSAPEDSTF